MSRIYPHIDLTPTILSGKDWHFNGVTGVSDEILKEDGDWSDYLPDAEIQRSLHFDTMGCVSFSANNCLEILAAFAGVVMNLSDRFVAKESGTTRRGNYYGNVAETLRMKGAPPEESWPYPREEWGFDWDDYYKEIPESIREEAKQLLEDWEISWHWVANKDIPEALKRGPLQVSVYAWPKPLPDGRYDDGGVVKRNHAVTCYKENHIFDHYEAVRKELVPDYNYKWAVQFHLKPKKDIIMQLPNNILVQQTGDGGNGQFALHLDGKLYIDQLDKLLATWIVRNHGRGITKEVWDSFEHVNLKNEPLNK